MCQVTAENILNEHIHHSRLYSERSEKGIRPIALQTRYMLWLPTMEV